VVEDISELKRAEEQLHRLSQAVEQSSESIVITDGGCIEYVNEAFTRITGYERDEVIGANLRVLQSSKTPPEVYEAMWMGSAGRTGAANFKTVEGWHRVPAGGGDQSDPSG
jgi:PAS domain S-box-containing protein